MPIEILMDYFAKNSEWKKIEFQIAVQCAPVLKGVKASNIISLPTGTWGRLQRARILREDIKGMLLYKGKKKEVILFYREKWMHNILKDERVREFFEDYGYGKKDLYSVLERLKKRYENYAQGEEGFPHELGILLQYPLEDVKGFIANNGKNSILCGYWKVYHKPDKASRIFALYDRVRDRAALEFIGSSVQNYQSYLNMAEES